MGRAVQWAIDRMLSVAYGTVYDFIFERFLPYQALQREIVSLVEASVPAAAARRDVRVLDIGCGPGNFTVTLARAGFSVVGVDPYDALVELAREKRRAHHLANLAFRHADLARGDAFREAFFDQVVNVHSLYVHPAPEQLLKEAYRALKPGGHGVFVNFTKRVWLWPALREVAAREGLAATFRCMLWALPNAVFEATRKPIGPHYWQEEEFAAHLRNAGFSVLEIRRTFLNGVSLLAWVQKPPEAGAAPGEAGAAR